MRFVWLVMLATTGTVSGSEQIDTISTCDGSSAVSSLGEPNTAYVGQSFVALDQEVASISFLLNGWDWPGAPYPTEFRLLLTPLAPTGDRPDFDHVLFESGDLSTTLDAPFELFEASLNTLVTPGGRYIWLLDAFVLQNGTPDATAVAVNESSYAPGEFLYFNVPEFSPSIRADHDDWPWNALDPKNDLACRVSFVPEASSLALCAVVLLMINLPERRRVTACSARRPARRLAHAVLIVLAITGAAFGSSQIDTLSSWDGATQVTALGDLNTAYCGQSFTALDERINSIAFVLNGWDWAGAPYPTRFHLLLTPLALTGDRPDFDNVLFETGDLSTTLNSGFELFEVSLNTAVLPGAHYIWVLDAFVLRDGLWDDAAVGANPDSYDGGDFFLFNAPEFSPSVRTDHDNEPWYRPQPMNDLAFRITFVPEVSSGALCILLFLMVAAGDHGRGSR
jgi:hypothetical protein